MAIDSIDTDFEVTFSLSEWLESEEARKTQRHLEEKIITLLFSTDRSSFQRMVEQLAWIGSHPSNRSLIEKEIIALNFSDEVSVEQCGFLKEVGKVGRKVGNFVADHAVEIVVGAALCAVGVGLAEVLGYTLSASVGGVVVAGTGSIFYSEKKPNPFIPSTPLPDPRACSKEEFALLQQSLFPSGPKIELPSSVNELLVTPNGVWANGQFYSTDTLMKHSLFSPLVTANRPSDSLGGDWKSFTYYNYLSEQLRPKPEGQTPSYQTYGESALALGHYSQAVQDLGKAIEVNPADPTSYLERGAALFNLGEYESSLEDYQRFSSQAPTSNSLSVSEFTLGFAKGLPKGIYESGEGVLLFLADAVKHPIQTSKQVIDSITTLANLVRQDEWGMIAEALSPEMHQLITQWDTLPSDKRGELAGYALGKHGADIFAPGALMKIANKSIKSAQELAAVCKNIQIAQETLVLETAAGMGNSVKVAEVIEAGQKTAMLAEELGFSAREMGSLKQAGQLETAIQSTFERLSLPMRESFELFEKAEKQLRQYRGFMTETVARELIHEAGIPTFPRPLNIPENFRVKISDKGAGIKYIHPENEQTYIRVMPGKPHAKYPHQQKPYVIQMKDGKTLDKTGKVVAADSAEAHIPLEEFTYPHYSSQ